MAEELKQRIYEFLKKNPKKRFSLKEVSRQTKISYPSVLKWASVLIAEGDRDPKVRVEDRGHIKFVWVE